MSWTDWIPTLCFVIGYVMGTAATLWVTLTHNARIERERRSAAVDAMLDKGFAKIKAATEVGRCSR